MGIDQNTGYEHPTDGIGDPVDAAINKYDNHPSILKIKEMVNDKNTEPFNFTKIDTEYMEMEIKKLNVKKATTF